MRLSPKGVVANDIMFTLHKSPDLYGTLTNSSLVIVRYLTKYWQPSKTRLLFDGVSSRCWRRHSLSDHRPSAVNTYQNKLVINTRGIHHTFKFTLVSCNYDDAVSNNTSVSD